MYEKSGLVQLGRSSPLIALHRTLYVITHPFWRDDTHPYIDNIEKLIREDEAPILTLAFPLDDIIRRYAEIGSNGGRFFLPTESFLSAKPDCGWEITAEIINQFKPEDVIFGGSALGKNKRRDEGYRYCVGLSYNELGHLVPNPRVDESLCDIVLYEHFGPGEREDGLVFKAYF